MIKALKRGILRGIELLVNGDFSAGTAGWTQSSATLTIVSGRGRHAATAANGANQRTFTGELDKLYELVFDVTANTDTVAAFIQIREAASTSFSLNITINQGVTGQFRGFFRCTTAASRVHIRSAAASTGFVEFDNISVREVRGQRA